MWSTLVSRFTVPGSPMARGEAGADEEGWKRHCRDEAQAAHSTVTRPITQPVKLVCHFHVLRQAKQHDIDNLIKNLIDAIGAGGFFAPSKKGGTRSQWNTDDNVVFAIEATKDIVDENPRTDVELWI